jgi:predicted metal-dependent hydrolase
MHRIQVSNLTIDIVRKKIKNLHLGVYPPKGRIRVAAPESMDDDAIRLVIVTKLAWIKRQQNHFRSQERQSPREYVYHESHYFLGHRYLLNVVEVDGPARVCIRNKKLLDLYVPKGSDIKKRQKVLHSWYRKQLRSLMPGILKKWEKILDIHIKFYGIKKMKTKWGSCNPRDSRIWINLELAKKPVQCLEYIIVHEMLHVKNRHHDEAFARTLDHFMPQWQSHRNDLNRAPLAHENWNY